MDNKLIFLDTETTDTGDDAELVQIAYKGAGDSLLVEGLFKPTKPVQIEAMAVNHITNKMLEKHGPFEGSPMQQGLKSMFHEHDGILVAHNAEFDHRMLVRGGVTPKHIICTMKCVRYLDEKDEIPNYKMQYIRYLWGIESDGQSHNAVDDVVVLEKIFDRLHEKLTIDAMLKITAEPFLLRKLSFGKHKGIPFRDIPRDYLRWLRMQDKIDGDLLYTINFYINKE